MGSLGREMRRMIGLRPRSRTRDNTPRPPEPHMSRHALLAWVLFALPAAADDVSDALAKELRDYATKELARVPGKASNYSTALADYLRNEIAEANQADREAWAKVQSRADWEKFRDTRIKVLRDSLGTWPEVPKSVPTRVTKTFEAGDYAIDNLL